MMEKVWVIKDTDSYLKDQTPESEEVDEPPPAPIEKSPAIAYTLSIIFWGAGQLYIGQKAKGEWFLFLMLLVFFALILVFESWFHLFNSCILMIFPMPGHFSLSRSCIFLH
jgi:hypothetical protein